MRSKLPQIVLELEVKRGRRIMQTEIASACGLTETTVSKWMDVKPITRIEVSTLNKLARWAGLDNPFDLLVIEQVES